MRGEEGQRYLGTKNSEGLRTWTQKVGKTQWGVLWYLKGCQGVCISDKASASQSAACPGQATDKSTYTVAKKSIVHAGVVTIVSPYKAVNYLSTLNLYIDRLPLYCSIIYYVSFEESPKGFEYTAPAHHSAYIRNTSGYATRC